MKKILSLITIVLLLNLSIVSAAEMTPQMLQRTQTGLPDLSIRNVQIQDNGLDATIKIQVKNQGRTNVEGFWYYINYGDSTGEFLYFEDTIRARQTKIITLTHAYTSAGNYNGMVNLDPVYMIQESDETNNTENFVVEIEEPLADLGIKHIQIRERNSEATIKIQVKNYGTENVEGFWYYINYGDSTGEFLYFEDTIRARQTKIITLTHTYTSAGNYNGMVNLDPVYMIQESNETNNTQNFVVEIERLGDNTTSKISALSQE